MNTPIDPVKRKDPHFPVEAWALHETGLDISDLARTESLFALSNGHIGIRGNLEEGDPRGLPGTYLNSFYEARPLPYAEAGYGFPEDGQTILNVTNGKIFRVLIDDEVMDLRYGTIDHHQRILDLRSGLLHRIVEWTSPSGQKIRLRTTRLVSFSQRSVMAIRWELEATNDQAQVVVQSELVANEYVPAQSKDPRVAVMMENALEPLEHRGDGNRAFMLHGTRKSHLRMAAAMDHVIDAPDGFVTELTATPDWARLMVSCRLQPGERLGLTKFVSYGWSSQRSMHALTDQVSAALASVRRVGWDHLVDDQHEAMRTFWDNADVEIVGADAIQQAVRVALFHTYQAGLRAEQRAIPAKGLTGPGYDGHAFWDTEMFVLPVLVATSPDAARDALIWRWSTLDLARERAAQLHRRGAVFPWRTIRGQETSGYWPAGTAAMHINADIAAATQRYLDWTDDEEFDRQYGVEILVETARLWMSLGYFGADDKFHIDGVTGPDEYSAIVRDNIYTNLMAARNLRNAAAAVERWSGRADELHVVPAESTAWLAAANAVAMPWSEEHQVYEQDLGFTSREVWDFERTNDHDAYPLLLNAPYFEIYRKQVIKQADLILAMHWCGDEFSLEEKARALEYYDKLTVRDSSLSACTQAIVAAEVGQLELAADYLAEAAMMDLHNLERNTGDGLHIASLAGAWLAVVAGFGGMRDHRATLSFHPQLPPGWTSLRFRLVWRGARILVHVADGEVTYEVTNAPDDGLTIRHCADEVVLKDGQPVTLAMEIVEPITERPVQPAGRTPIRASDLP